MLALIIAAQVAGLGATDHKVDLPMATPTTAPSFADEFDGTAIDTRKWRFDTVRNAEGWFNNELQYYSANRAENARIEDGALVIEARRETLPKRRFVDWGGQGYTSARVVTQQDMGFGFYEIRARIPCARGTWPAIWMLPRDGKWPDAGEIDIMEHVGWDPGRVHGNSHTKAYNHVAKTQKGAWTMVPTTCSAFHDYQLLWTKDRIVIGVDGKGYMAFDNDKKGNKEAWPFDDPQYLILNIAIGGWGGEQGIDPAAFPAKMEVEYVRVWQKR